MVGTYVYINNKKQVQDFTVVQIHNYKQYQDRTKKGRRHLFGNYRKHLQQQLNFRSAHPNYNKQESKY